jgi:hypothetical protein
MDNIPGELVETVEETIERFDSKWKLTIEVYHRPSSNPYILHGKLKEDSGFFERPDKWELTVHSVSEDELDYEVEELSEQLLTSAEERIEAREIDIDVDVT